MREGEGPIGVRGDILLYHTGGTLRDRVVCAYTAGPFCHCEIDLGDGYSVGAHSEDGITCTPEHLLDRRVIISLQMRTAPERIEAGLAWVMQHVGEPFSWASIGDLVIPAGLSTLLFGRRSVYNCANLVATYLEIAGGLDVSYGKRPPMIVSPNDIARAAGLLPLAATASRPGLSWLPAAITVLLTHRRPDVVSPHVVSMREDADVASPRAQVSFSDRVKAHLATGLPCAEAVKDAAAGDAGPDPF